MDALELALHCSSLLMRTMTKELRGGDVNCESLNASQNSASFVSTLRQQLDDSDCERHFKLCGQFMTSDCFTDLICLTVFMRHYDILSSGHSKYHRRKPI